MTERICRVCDNSIESKKHMDSHTLNEKKEYYYKKHEETFYCEMCPNTEDEESKILTHVFKYHDKEERKLEITKPTSGYFTEW